MEYVSGRILKENGFKKGYIGFEKNLIKDIGNDKPPHKAICKGLIIPSTINCHTHIGDSFVKNKNIDLPRNILDLVAPPNGLKHKLLRDASEIEIIKGIKQSIRIMQDNGTSFFCDFRENGLQGIKKLKSAIKNEFISACILSRPKENKYEKDEINTLLKNSQGLGLSSISDWDYSEIYKISKHVKRNKKILALHASEHIREDIDLVLDLKPDFLIHMNKAKKSDFITIRENNIPLVLCPRSNHFFGLKINYKLLKEVGVSLMLGSDNCMINSPNVFEEIRFILDKTNVFTLEELLNMVTFSPSKVLNLRPAILGLNSPAEFVVIDPKSFEVLYTPKKRVSKEG